MMPRGRSVSDMTATESHGNGDMAGVWRRLLKTAGFGGLALAGLWVAVIGLTAPWYGAPEGVTLSLFSGGVLACVFAAAGGLRALRGDRSAGWLVSWIAVLVTALCVSALFYAA